MNTATKERIQKVVKEYIKMFPSEYDAFVKGVRFKQENKHTKWAEVQGAKEQIIRHLIEVPETLYYAFRQQLRKEELDWLYSREDYKSKREGMNWFIRKFPQFKITEDA